jgi:fumarate hydratase class II
VSETVPRELWGGETRKAVENFPVSGEPIPVPVARWLGRIKAAAARVNAELFGCDKATEIVKEAARSSRPLREVAREAGVEEDVLDKALDYRARARPHSR